MQHPFRRLASLCLALGLAGSLALAAAEPASPKVPAANKAERSEKAGKATPVRDKLLAEWNRLEARVSLTKEDETPLLEAIAAGAADLRTARAEIAVIKAQIARELVNAKPDLAKVKALVKQSLDQELVIRMTEIQRQLAIRDRIGEDRWTALSQALRTFRKEFADALEDDAVRKSRLFRLLDALDLKE